MSLLIFCPTQTKQPMDQSPPRQWQIQWISKRWPLSKTVAQKHSICWAAHTLNWLSARQVLNAWLEMFPQAIFTQLFPSNSEKTFFSIFTMSLTPGGSPPVILFHLGLYGAVFPAMSPPGPAGVWPASGARSTATHAWSHSPSPSRNGVFLIYMLIWWAHCSTVISLIIFVLSLIARPSGWMPSPFQKRLRRHAQKL
jgi:hypothetical protein